MNFLNRDKIKLLFWEEENFVRGLHSNAMVFGHVGFHIRTFHADTRL